MSVLPLDSLCRLAHGKPLCRCRLYEQLFQLFHGFLVGGEILWRPDKEVFFTEPSALPQRPDATTMAALFLIGIRVQTIISEKFIELIPLVAGWASTFHPQMICSAADDTVVH